MLLTQPQECEAPSQGLADSTTPQSPSNGTIATRSSISSGGKSFSVPRVVIEMLIDSGATALEILIYLVLATFTDRSGQFSVASVNAASKLTSTSKKRIARELKQLLSRRIGVTPIVLDREAALNLGPLPDGLNRKYKVMHVLHNFGEPLEDRVWIASGLVEGFREFTKPLAKLKNAGDVPTRLLLLMYALNDMDSVGGVVPSSGLYRTYVPKQEPVSFARCGINLITAKRSDCPRPKHIIARVASDLPSEHQDSSFVSALRALEAAGFIYEMVSVLNRGMSMKPALDSTNVQSMDPDAETMFELGCRSRHGYKPAGEEGVGGDCARTAGELGHAVADSHGTFDGTYAAFVPTGIRPTICGIFRLRFRVANPKNAGVKDAWIRIHEGNREARKCIEMLRKANGLEPLKVSSSGSRSEARAIASGNLSTRINDSKSTA